MRVGDLFAVPPFVWLLVCLFVPLFTASCFCSFVCLSTVLLVRLLVLSSVYMFACLFVC